MLRSKFLVLPALALTLALAGCGSSKNNSSNKNAANQTAPTQAAPIAATTAASSATKAAGSVTAPTQAATVAAASATKPASGSSVVISASSVSGGSSSSTTVCSSSSSSTNTGQIDANLQSLLAKVALTDKDLPAGYTSLSGFTGGAGQSDLTYANETAAYSDFFVKPNLTGASASNPLGGDLFIESLNGFKDAGSAGSTLKDLRAQALKQACTPETKIEQVSGAPKLGDETLAYKISSSGEQVYTGYIIVWRRGKVDAIVGMIGNPGPKSLDETSALAQKLDAKMKAGGL